MNAASRRARAIALPAGVQVASLYPGAFLADAYAIDLPPDATQDALTLAHFSLTHQAPWVGWLMGMRDAIVARFGLKTARALQADTAGTARIGIFRVYETLPGEVVLGEDDRHLDFRLSMQRSADQLVAVTVVHCHNLLGRSYIRVIAPFHRMVVRSMLNRAAKAGWPTNAEPRL